MPTWRTGSRERRMSRAQVVSCVAAAGVVLAVAAGPAAAARGQETATPPGDVRLLGQLITLDAPASDVAAQTALIAVAGLKGVRLGIEGPALPVGQPSFDFAHPPDHRLTLTGLTVAQALDKVAEADPNFHWTTQAGALVGRFATGPTLLDRKLDRFVVADASPRAALSALIAALDPARSGQGIVGMGRAPAGRADQPPSRLGRNVSVALDHPTVGDVLTALMREDSALSWRVAYQEAPATYENAQINLLEGDDVVSAMPAASLSAPQTVRPAATFVIGGSDLFSLHQGFAHFMSGLKLGFEGLPLPASRSFISTTPVVLGGLPPEETLRRLTAYDSRYETVQINGRFVTRPKAGAREAEPFAATLPAFSRSDEPFNVVLTDLTTRLGATTATDVVTPSPTPLPAGTPTTPPGAPRSADAQASAEVVRSRAISVSWPAGRSVSEAISALADAINARSWTLRGTELPSGTTTYQLMFDTDAGFSFGKTFQVAAAVAPAATVRALPRPLPPEIGARQVGRIAVSDALTNGSLMQLAAQARIPLGLEAGSSVTVDPRIMTRSTGGTTLVGPGTVTEVLAALLAHWPDRDYDVDAGVLTIAPAANLHDPNHFLNKPIGRFDVQDQTVRGAIFELRRRMNPAFVVPASSPPGVRMPTPLDALIEQHVTLILENPTPRQVLDAIVAKVPGLFWTVSYRGPGGGTAAQVREADCVITIGSPMNPTSTATFMPPGAFANPPPVTRPTGSHQVIPISMPLSAAEMPSAMMQLERTLKTVATYRAGRGADAGIGAIACEPVIRRGRFADPRRHGEVGRALRRVRDARGSRRLPHCLAEAGRGRTAARSTGRGDVEAFRVATRLHQFRPSDARRASRHRWPWRHLHGPTSAELSIPAV